MSNLVKSMLRKVVFFAANPFAIVHLKNLPRYLSGRNEFKRLGGKIDSLVPVLNEFSAPAGKSSGQYFHQDLLVATFIHTRNPRRHIDVGSSISGFVAHVASFRKIEVLDIRPLMVQGHDNIAFVQADLMNSNGSLPHGDSVSCLHAIEYFGLGRYSDPIDPLGHIKGFRNLVSMIEPEGTLYISFPISRNTQVTFNAQRSFSPVDILSWDGCNELELRRFDYVDHLGDLRINVKPSNMPDDFTTGCGIYTFTKKY